MRVPYQAAILTSKLGMTEIMFVSECSVNLKAS